MSRPSTVVTQLVIEEEFPAGLQGVEGCTTISPMILLAIHTHRRSSASLAVDWLLSSVFLSEPMFLVSVTISGCLGRIPPRFECIRGCFVRISMALLCLVSFQPLPQGVDECFHAPIFPVVIRAHEIRFYMWKFV